MHVMSIVVRTISDQLVDLLRERILSGKMASGNAIRQDSLAGELGISKIPLREALARLEQDGLLQSQPNRGFFVRPMSADELEEIYALRLKLEPDAVVAGSREASPEARAHAVEALEEFRREADARHVSGGTHNRAFHMALIVASGQRITYEILERLHVLADRYVCKHLEPLGRSSRADLEHEEILDAWLNRDFPRLHALTEQHISSTLNDLRNQLHHTPALAEE